MAKKGMVIVVEKAALFEANNYNDVSAKELDVLMQWYDVEKRQRMKKANKVWRGRIFTSLARHHQWFTSGLMRMSSS